jgi:Tfp pilus assembly protein PilV
MHQKQNGFSILEILLIVAVVGLIAVVAWMFFNRESTQSDNTTTKTNQTEKQSSNETIKEAPKDPVASWYEYTPVNKVYSIKLADGWNLYKKDEQGASLYSTSNLIVKDGTAAKILEGTGQLDKCGSFILDYLDYAWPEKYKKADAEMLTSNSGLSIEKTAGIDELGISGGGMGYTYTATKNNSTVIISYSSCKDGPDYHETVEKAVRTLSIQ